MVYITVDGQTTRAYALSHAAALVTMSDSTLRRQLQAGTFVGAATWPPKSGPNHTVKYLLSADGVDRMVNERTGDVNVAAPMNADLERLQRENDELRFRNERLELEVAVRDNTRVDDLEKELVELRQQLRHQRTAMASVLAALNELGGVPVGMAQAS